MEHGRVTTTRQAPLASLRSVRKLARFAIFFTKLYGDYNSEQIHRHKIILKNLRSIAQLTCTSLLLHWGQSHFGEFRDLDRSELVIL